MGVTGTLKDINFSKRKIINDIYNIKTNTYMPSVFGYNKLDFPI